MRAHTLILLVAMATPARALAAEATAMETLKKLEAAMSPETSDMRCEMKVAREDGTAKTYVLRVLKKGLDRSRVWFDAPASVAGQEILQVAENAWIYMPDIKRATSLSSRESFQGGDFSNADMLRNFSADYEPAFIDAGDPALFALELKAKTAQTPYESVRVWASRKDNLLVRAQYFGSGGRLMRTATFHDPQEFRKGYTRPARVVMTNELVKGKATELTIKKLEVDLEIPDRRFSLTDLGK